MSRWWRPLVGVVAVVDVTGAVAGQLIAPPDTSDPATAAILTLAVASIAGVGAFLAIRVPANRVSWLLVGAGTMLAAGIFSGSYARASVAVWNGHRARAGGRGR